MTRQKRSQTASAPARKHVTLLLGLAGGVLLWAAFPPLDWRWLAWLAPIPWLGLVRSVELTGRRPYLVLWVASLAHWLPMIQGIRLAHWLNHFGWLALASYLAVYLPLFVGLTRFALHRLKCPLVVGAPVVWTALELVRGHLFTGFSMGMLGHSQFEYPLLIQLADFGGAYAVSFVMMFVSACLVAGFPNGWGRPMLKPLLAASGALLLTVGYGWHRTSATEQVDSSPQLKVALIQAKFNTRFEFDPERNLATFMKYLELTRSAVEQHPDLDIVIWPESVFSENTPEVLVDEGAVAPPSLTVQQLQERSELFEQKVLEVAQQFNRMSGERLRLIVGTETWWLTSDGENLFNSALLIDPTGQVTDRYHKMHPVMFGEYIPFGSTFPVIYSIFPLGRGLTPGPGAVGFEVGELRFSPSICFESAVPHLLRRQFSALRQAGETPDVLVNLTHDGWFWGSSILDFQLAGAVFRAVESRRPFLVAANSGISAWIDDAGRIQARGPKQGEAIVLARVQAAQRESAYMVVGDLFAGVCLALTTVCGVLACLSRTRFWAGLPNHRLSAAVGGSGMKAT